MNIIPTLCTTKIKNFKDNCLFNTFKLLNADIINLSSLNKNKHIRTYDYCLHNIEHYEKFSFNRYTVHVCNNKEMKFEEILTDNIDFLQKCRNSLMSGPGFLVIKDLFSDIIEQINDKLPQDLSNTERWNGDVLNRDIMFCKLIDNNLIKIIIESLLGWDCHLDNTAFSYSRYDDCKYKIPFGPHQDSPFDMNPGAILPPSDYPVVIQCIYSFDDMTKDNGGFYVVPYSHQNRQRVNLISQGNLKFGEIPNNAYCINANKGDVIITLGNIWHGAYPNTNNKQRRTLLSEFVNPILNTRDTFDNIDMKYDINILKHCSRRMIRLLNDGRKKSKDNPILLNEWYKYQNKHPLTT